MGVPMQRAANLGERATLNDAEFAAKEAAAKKQAQADSESVSTSDTRSESGRRRIGPSAGSRAARPH